MKIFIAILIIILVFVALGVISYFKITAFVNEIDIVEVENGEDGGITQPSKSEIKNYLFFAETIMQPAYKSIVKKCELTGDEKVMDFGSGAGPSSSIIARELEGGKGELTCLDISESWIKVVKHRFKEYDHVNYILGDITTMELVENAYDVILIHFVLHDIDKAIRNPVIEKLAYILKPGGRLIIREPVSDSHGMPGDEVRQLMQENGMVERSFLLRKTLLFIPVVEGIYYKNQLIIN
jgi:ubiquinone/menaquinone biosynthesis C-methylase UbiE